MKRLVGCAVYAAASVLDTGRLGTNKAGLVRCSKLQQRISGYILLQPLRSTEACTRPNTAATARCSAPPARGDMKYYQHGACYS